MEPFYGILLLLLGLIVTFVFFYIWLRIQMPKKPKDPEDNEVLRRSGLLDDSE